LDPEAGEPAETEATDMFMSTIVELDAELLPVPVPIVRVVAEVSRARLPSEGAGVARRTGYPEA
jgi:hypothetical protein